MRAPKKYTIERYTQRGRKSDRDRDPQTQIETETEVSPETGNSGITSGIWWKRNWHRREVQQCREGVCLVGLSLGQTQRTRQGTGSHGRMKRWGRAGDNSTIVWRVEGGRPPGAGNWPSSPAQVGPWPARDLAATSGETGVELSGSPGGPSPRQYSPGRDPSQSLLENPSVLVPS